MGIQKGETLGIAAASSPFDPSLFQKGIDLLKHFGFEVFFREDIFSKETYLAGSDERRARELEELFANPKIKAILFARGGYGVQRILPLLDTKILKKNPKPIIGFSDLTPLINFCGNQLRVPAFYGPVMTQLGNDPSPLTLKTLREILLHGTFKKPIDLKSCQIIKAGKTSGPLVGGCLSLVNSSLKTPYEIDPKGGVLFFEETQEKTYAIDRMITQLKNSGFLKRCSGILVGSIDSPPNEKNSVDAMLKERLSDFGGPIVTHFPAGHTKNFHTLPIGVQTTLDTTTQKLSFQ